jgi:hypothetical protein
MSYFILVAQKQKGKKKSAGKINQGPLVPRDR